MDVELTLDEVNYFDELYVPHPIIGAINQNPPEGTVALDRKWSKETIKCKILIVFYLLPLKHEQ